MNYIVSNYYGKREVRVSFMPMDGSPIYSGHKLGIDDDILPSILLFKIERSTKKYFFIDYKKWNDIYSLQRINPMVTDCWISHSDKKKSMMESYNSLITLMDELYGSFKNIYIIET